MDKELAISFQYFVTLTKMWSVDVMEDERTYDYAVALRAVNTVEFMTAEAAEIPWGMLRRVTSRIINEVGHENRVDNDCMSKPPGRLYWSWSSSGMFWRLNRKIVKRKLEKQIEKSAFWVYNKLK